MGVNQSGVPAGMRHRGCRAGVGALRLCCAGGLWVPAGGDSGMRRAGVGHFNNNFKVADDIRLLGAVPEEEEEREVPIDKHMAKAMEERLLKGIEQEMLRDKQAIIRSFMKDSTGAVSPSVRVRCCSVDCPVATDWNGGGLRYSLAVQFPCTHWHQTGASMHAGLLPPGDRVPARVATTRGSTPSSLPLHSHCGLFRNLASLGRPCVMPPRLWPVTTCAAGPHVRM